LFAQNGESIPKTRRHHLIDESHEQLYQNKVSN
jgi:hypothetical protein